MSEPIKLALFGTPIKSSLSPFIHGRFAQQAGLEIDYRLIDTGPEGFPQLLEAFRQSGGVGCNVTLPLKRQAWQLSTEASPHVMEAQSANTLIDLKDGGWMAHTTDGVGLLTDLKVNQGLSLDGKRILLMGAGGAAAGVLGNLIDENPQAIVVVNRNLERARAMLGQFNHSSSCRVVSWGQLTQSFAFDLLTPDLPKNDLSAPDLAELDLSGPDLSAFDLIINATSLGHEGEPPALTRGMFSEGALCYDLNYFNAGVPLKKLCAQLGTRYCDGLGMLVEQAAKSFYLWTGFQAETRTVIEACVAAMPGGQD